MVLCGGETRGVGGAGKNVEAMLGVGQVYIEQARFEAGVLVPALDNVDSELYKSLNPEELEEISKGHGRDANTKLKLALKNVRHRPCRRPHRLVDRRMHAETHAQLPLACCVPVDPWKPWQILVDENAFGASSRSVAVSCGGAVGTVCACECLRETEPTRAICVKEAACRMMHQMHALLRVCGACLSTRRAVQVKKGDVEKSRKAWDKVFAQFKAAEAVAEGEKTEKTKEREAARTDAVVSPPFTDETHLLPNQVKIIWGNALYDQSQIWAGVGLAGWKEMVEDAKSRFLSATCKEKDVLEALRNHINASELDLPAEEKVEEKEVPAAKPAEGEAAAAKEAAPKGLPALKGKKKRPAA